MTNSDGVAECSIRARFDDLRRRLEDGQEAGLLGREHWDRPLGYWAWAGDRRLPYALIDRTVREVLRASFQDLSQTPGIGKKKMAALVMLLERAVRHEVEPQTPLNPAFNADQDADPATDSFRFEGVSESHWELWRNVVRRNQLSQAPLGRFAPTLQALPSVVWKTPLETYLEATLASMRTMKAHGDKRIRGIVEIFFHLHRALGSGLPVRHLASALRPKFIVGIEQAVLEILNRNALPELHDIQHNLTLPLLNQIELDGGETIGRLAAGRLAIESVPESVIEQAERMQVTRARIYQLLEICAEIMAVRWPEGRWQLAMVAKQLATLDAADPRREMVETLESLLFPQKLRPVAAAVSEGSVANVTANSAPTVTSDQPELVALYDSESVARSER